jgi:hypothetical protein
MIRVQELRKAAELMRQMAGTPAGRDPLLDRELLVLADQLEEEADARLAYLQRQSNGFVGDS